jgi:hypothetical protein
LATAVLHRYRRGMLLESPSTEAISVGDDLDRWPADRLTTTGPERIRRRSAGATEILLTNGGRVRLFAGNGAGDYPPGYLERLRTTGEC